MACLGHILHWLLHNGNISVFVSKMIRLWNKPIPPLSLSLSHSLSHTHTWPKYIWHVNLKLVLNVSELLQYTRQIHLGVGGFLTEAARLWGSGISKSKDFLVSSRGGGCSDSHSTAVYVPYCADHCWHCGGQLSAHRQFQRYRQFKTAHSEMFLLIFLSSSSSFFPLNLFEKKQKIVRKHRLHMSGNNTQ